MRLQRVNVDHVSTTRRLVRLAVTGAEQHRGAEAGLDRDLPCGLAVAVELRLVRRRSGERGLVCRGRARRRDTGADRRLRLSLDRPVSLPGDLRVALRL